MVELITTPNETIGALRSSDMKLPASYQNTTGYFRSKLFSSNAASNPLVAAASPLLSLLERLCVSQTLPTIDHIRDNLEHELRAFHSRLTGQHYAEDTLALGHYLLCATIDEILGKNFVRIYGQHAEFKAFTPSSSNNKGPETQFFIIVAYLKERATQYLDLIELSYYCLIAGFEGEHHVRADGRQILDNLIDDIHKLIQQQRVHKPQLLFKASIPVSSESKSHKPLLAITFAAVALFIAAYIGSHQLLNYQAKRVLHTFTLQSNMER